MSNPMLLHVDLKEDFDNLYWMMHSTNPGPDVTEFEVPLQAVKDNWDDGFEFGELNILGVQRIAVANGHDAFLVKLIPEWISLDRATVFRVKTSSEALFISLPDGRFCIRHDDWTWQVAKDKPIIIEANGAGQPVLLCSCSPLGEDEFMDIALEFPGFFSLISKADQMGIELELRIPQKTKDALATICAR